jgi:hypothetical protein
VAIVVHVRAILNQKCYWSAILHIKSGSGNAMQGTHV